MENNESALSMAEAIQIRSDHPDVACETLGAHLDDAVLLRMTDSGGLAGDELADKHHLSLCPLCLSRWRELLASRSSISLDDTVVAADDWYTGGLMEACAGHRLDLPLRLQSRCGRFSRGIYGNNEDAEQAMVAVEYIGEDELRPEGRQVTVCDRQGKELISAPLRRGRAAASLRLDDRLDLGAWTVRVHGVDNDQ